MTEHEIYLGNLSARYEGDILPSVALALAYEKAAIFLDPSKTINRLTYKYS